MKQAQLSTKQQVTRDNILRAFPLNESDKPKTPACLTTAFLLSIIAYLAVDKSARYKQKRNPQTGNIVSTYCNIYAFDYVNIAGGYIPRVFWNKKAVADLEAGKDVEAIYPTKTVTGTITELNANDLYLWFEAFGSKFGWRKAISMDEAQEAANAGKIVCISGIRKERKYSGHITCVVPENGDHKAKRGTDGKVIIPLQSQAGAQNFQFYVGDWYKGKQFEAYGAYIYG